MRTDTVDLEKAGKLLRAIREGHSLSRPQLADRSQVSVAAIRNIENNHRADGQNSHPYSATVTKLARAFGAEAGSRILEAFDYGHLASEVFTDPDTDTSGTFNAAELGISNEQAAIINQLVEGLIELARSGNTNPRRPNTISVIRANPR